MFKTNVALMVMAIAFAFPEATAQSKPAPVTDTVKTLAEIKVSAKKPFIEYKTDRTVLNPQALISGAGLNALELLERMPGVIVHANGSISMSGKTGVLMMIDGKPTYLSGEQLAAYLKSLPAATLERIELIPNPPARYDAAGSAGIIDIRSKKSRTEGWQGTAVLNAGTSRAYRTSGSINLNYYKGKINLFTNVGYSEINSHRILKLERDYYTGNQLATRYVQTSDSRPFIKSKTVKSGADYFVSLNTTLGIVFNGAFSPGRNTNPVIAFLYNGQNSLDSVIKASNKSNNQFNNTTLNLNFLHRIKGGESTVSADLDWVKYKADSKQEFLNSTLFSNGAVKSSEKVTANLPVNIVIYTGKSDYSKSLPGKQKLEFGIKSSFVTAGNISQYFTWQNNMPAVDERNTNQFNYEENIFAGYANFNKENKWFSFQLGLRAENTNIHAKQFGNPSRNDSAFRQRYTNVFPTAYLSYKLDSNGNHSINASYGRRIDRPYYKDLNPFIYVLDKYTWFAGNPLLQPQFSSNYSITYRFKSLLSCALFYYNYDKYQTEAISEHGGVFINRPANIGKRIYKGISATVSTALLKWWRMNVYSEIVNMKFSGELNKAVINSNSTYYYIECGNQFDLGKSWALELNGFYITRRTAAQFNLNPKGQLALGVQKKFWKNRASFRFAASDIFRTNNSAGTLGNIPGVSSSYRSDLDTRMINVGLSLNFGNAGNTLKNRSTGSSQSEQNRVKN